MRAFCFVYLTHQRYKEAHLIIGLAENFSSSHIPFAFWEKSLLLKYQRGKFPNRWLELAELFSYEARYDTRRWTFDFKRTRQRKRREFWEIWAPRVARSYNSIPITNETVTMVETARFLHFQMQGKTKKIKLNERNSSTLYIQISDGKCQSTFIVAEISDRNTTYFRARGWL